MKGLIYILFFPSGKWYIGSTIQRWMSHRLGVHKDCLLRRRQSKLYEHWRELGWESMNWEIIDTVDVSDVKELRQKELELINSNFDENCLNTKLSISGLELKEWKQQYRQRNATANAEYMKAYRQANREYFKEYNRLWMRKKRAEAQNA